MKNILLGVTASVAAIKAQALVESLSEFANVKVVATEHARYFIDSLAINVPVLHDQDEWPPLTGAYDLTLPILHIEMRRWADLMLIAPLDANTLTKMVHGFSDNLLTSIVRAWDWQKPLVLCPAMNTMMWNNPPTPEHIAIMKSRGAVIIEPIEKKLACNDVGMGAMENVEIIVNEMMKILQPR